MQRFGWFSAPAGVWSERSALNYIIEGAEQGLGALDAKMGMQMAAMAKEVLVLHKLVEVLYHTLRDTPAVDTKALDARLEAALDELNAPRPTKSTITCVRCNGEFAPAQTTILPQGPMCDGCAAQP